MPDIDLMGATYPDVPAVDLPKSGGGTARFYDPSGIDYAGSPTSGGNANMANAILYGAVDSTSTSMAFTATVAGLTELVDGTTVMLRNGVVTSASGFTINVNGLGALPVYSNMATGNAITPTNPTRETTIFNINYTMMLTYVESDVVAGGCWICYRGYDANTNTIGYQLRTNSSSLVAVETGYKYRLWLTTADGSKMMPINTSTSTNATTNRSLNQRKFDPFGRIVYRATNGTCSANAALGATGIWDQYTLTIGYSYMQTGFSLTSAAPVYIKATPQADGSAVMSSIVQALPSTNDGFIYVMLGFAYSATAMELYPWHPVYWHDGTGIRLWTGAEPGGGSTVTVTPSLTSGTQVGTISVDGTSTTLYAPTPPTVPSASTTAPLMDGTASYGSGTDYARANHVHPTDTSRQATLVSGTNIKTVNGNSLLGSGDITTPTYTLPTASTSTLGGVKVDGSTITITDGVISSSGGGGGVDLVINVVVDSSGNVVSHDATTAACLDFAQAAVNNSDASAVAYVREYSYDDVDDVYGSYVHRLPLISASTASYGGSQYAADGGIQLSFSCVNATIAGSSKMFIRARRLEISTMNDDPEMPVSIAYTNKMASSNS